MQLDRTHIVVRVRSLSEIGDLALIMLRRYPQSVLVGFLVGAVTLALINFALIGWIPIQEASYGLDDEEAWGEIARYYAWMALLVVLQAPMAGVPMTLYLGQAVFEQQPTWSSVFKDSRRLMKRWLWVLGVLRLPIPVMLLLAIRWGQEASGFWDVFVPLIIVGVVVIVRSSRPFIPEILLLEQCQLRGPDDSVITAGRRSKLLHSPVASDMSGRFIAVSLVLFALTMSVLYSLMFVRGIATGLWNQLDLFVLLVLYPISLWAVSAVSVLVRLLNYLDTRIRLEGWEVELAVRAEAIRQFGEERLTSVADTTPNAAETGRVGNSSASQRTPELAGQMK